MTNNPLFTKTKQELFDWRNHKAFKSQKIPENLRDQIKLLLEKYPRPAVAQGLGLAASTVANFVKKSPNKSFRKNALAIKSTDGLPNIFQQIPLRSSEDKTSLLRFEMELPGKFILRLFK